MTSPVYQVEPASADPAGSFSSLGGSDEGSGTAELKSKMLSWPSAPPCWARCLGSMSRCTNLTTWRCGVWV